MRHTLPSALPSLIAIALIAGCTTPTNGVPVDPGPVAMAPVIWKENVSRATRIADYSECNAAAVGGHPAMPQAQIAALAQQIDPETLENFRNRCLRIKGYTVTERPTCSRDDVQSGLFVRSSDIDTLPPLGTVKCMYPEAGGFVTA